MKKNQSYKLGLPEAIGKKIEKTGQTRGAEKDTFYQNRVLRCSTVLIPIKSWNPHIIPPKGFERGYIVIASPQEYFSDRPPNHRPDLPQDLKLGDNLLVVYETRNEWQEYHPKKYAWKPAISRTPPLGGQYIARVPDTTRTQDSVERHGYIDKDSGGQGAGIRVYEYASSEEIQATRYQLSFLAWRTEGIFEMAKNEIAKKAGTSNPDESQTINPEECKKNIDEICEEMGLSNLKQLENNRIIDNKGRTVCPLCRKPISAIELASRVEQAEGRNVPDLTVTTANLFHVEELRVGLYNHRRYNLGWGHHHCNAAARDWGVDKTLEWMEEILRNNGRIP